MSNVPSPTAPPTALAAARRKATRVVILVLLTIFFALIASFLGYHGWLSWKVHSRLAQLQATQKPLTLAALNDFYPQVPEGSNAALLYERAFKLVKSSRSARFLETLDELPSGSGPLPAKLREAMESACQESTNAFEVLAGAAKMKRCRYPLDYRPGWATLMPHLRDIRQCSALELSRGVLEEQSGDIEHAVGRVETILEFSASLEPEPDLIGVLVQQRLDHHASELLRWILNHRQLSVSQLDHLRRIFQSGEHTGCLEKALMGERCFILSTFDYAPGRLLDLMDPGYEKRFLAILGIQVLRVSGALKRDEYRFLECAQEAQQILRLPLPARIERADDLRATINREARPKRFILTAMMFPPFLKAIVKNAEGIARHRLVLTALAIERYRLEHDRLPTSLNDLAPKYLSEVPPDPFSDKTLLYHPAQSEYAVYSIGPDRQDDGSAKSIPFEHKLDDPKGDIVFAVSRNDSR